VCDEYIAIQQDQRLRTLSRCAARSSGLRRTTSSSSSTPKDSSIAAISLLTSLAVSLILRSRNRRTSSAREIPCAPASSSNASACPASKYKFVRFIHHNIHQLRLPAVHREKSPQPAEPECEGGIGRRSWLRPRSPPRGLRFIAYDEQNRHTCQVCVVESP